MEKQAKPNNYDFSGGSVWKRIVSQAVPLTIAQLVHLLYNVVDRISIGHMPDIGSQALTGIGLTFPIITIIMAFTGLFGSGGIPLFSMARGAGDKEKAKKIMENSLTLLIGSAIALTLLGYLFRRPVLFALGASEASFVFADEYLKIYLIGTIFSMAATGMNGYINAQGFPRIGMLSIVIGAVINIILDPLFIFQCGMGISGAALATVISQTVSALWVLRFLTGKKALISLSIGRISLNKEIVLEIARLGTTNFIMQGTNGLVQIVCNATLQTYGGDLYVGVMTVANSVREIITLPINGIVNGALPVISFNFGAKQYDRVKKGIRFNALAGTAYTLLAWLLIFFFSHFWFGIFSSDPHLVEPGAAMLRIYFFGFVFMSFQFAGQSAFQALGDAKHAIFFSLLRKAVIVVPLTILLPRWGLGVSGVFWAEPISNFIGGVLCYSTMWLTVYRRLDSWT